MIRSRISGGYATLWPLRYYPNRMIACAATGIRAESFQSAHGFAVVKRHGSSAPFRIASSSIDKARLLAASLLPRHPCGTVAKSEEHGGAAVDVYRAVAMGKHDHILWQRLETIDEIDLPNRRDWYIDANGMRKEVGATDLEAASISDLAEELKEVHDKWTEDELDSFVNALAGKNWNSMTDDQKDEAFAVASASFASAEIRSLVEEWGATSAEHTVPYAQLTRERLKESQFPRISGTLSQVDVEAANAVGEQAGLFVRDQFGQEVIDLTARGKSIVEQGLLEGLGRNEIAEDLRIGLPEMWKKYGDNYSETVASNAMVRARSLSTASSLRDAGIERFEIQSVLDERTTVICECLNGQKIAVGSAGDIATNAAAAQSVDELREANPFVRSIPDLENGRTIIQTDLGVDIAYMDNESRNFDRVLIDDELAAGAMIGFPPYHHRCRTMVVTAI